MPRMAEPPIPPPATRPAPHPAFRTAMLVTGVVLIILSPVVGLLPGPGGMFVFAGGLILVLRASRWARLRWARLKRHYPRLGRLVDRVMRRRSALRRHARDKAAQQKGGRDTLTSPAPSDNRAGTRPSSLAAFSISTIKE